MHCPIHDIFQTARSFCRIERPRRSAHRQVAKGGSYHLSIFGRPHCSGLNSTRLSTIDLAPYVSFGLRARREGSGTQTTFMPARTPARKPCGRSEQVDGEELRIFAKTGWDVPVRRLRIPGLPYARCVPLPKQAPRSTRLYGLHQSSDEISERTFQ